MNTIRLQTIVSNLDSLLDRLWDSHTNAEPIRISHIQRLETEIKELKELIRKEGNQ